MQTMLLSLSLTSPNLHLSPNLLLNPISCFPKSKSKYRHGGSLLTARCNLGETHDSEVSEDAQKLPILSTLSDSSISAYNCCAGIGGLGFVETSYLSYLKMSNSEPFCPIGGGSCSDVLSSAYASVLGVPLPLIGMAAYGLVFLLGLKLGGRNLPININQTDGRLLLLSVSASMAAASSYFLYILSARFDGPSSCSYCLGSAILSFSLFFINLKEFRLQDLAKVAALPLLTAAIVLGLLNTSYSSLPPTSSSSAAMELPYHTTEISTESSPFAIALAKHLHSIGAKMYGAFWCTHCQEQKEIFGREAAKLLDYVECFPYGVKKGIVMMPACADVGIEGFPTWVINEEVLSGEKTLDELAEMSGFPGVEVNQPN